MGGLYRGPLTKTYSSLGPDTPPLGAIVWEKDSNGYLNGYIFVKNAESSSALVTKRPVYRDITGGAAQVKLVASNTASLFAGIPMAAIKAGEYGWVQFYGYCADAKVVGDGTNAVAVYSPLSVNGTGASANLVRAGAAGADAAYPNYAIALEATSDATSEEDKDVLLVCLAAWGAAPTEV
ncbi:MAG: hypothetical protein DRP82_01245 [Planctomycetota bacterium]|nr:MAG: hypothetical protein DRP82_01245 [Planctomycetota bacterium]